LAQRISPVIRGLKQISPKFSKEADQRRRGKNAKIFKIDEWREVSQKEEIYPNEFKS
jgi:hypothetical protein